MKSFKQHNEAYTDQFTHQSAEDDFLNVHVPVDYDLTFVGVSATRYLATGYVTSAVIPTFHTAAD